MQAAINVNIWITPDDASLDKSSGGLVIYTAKPPPDADFQSYNTNTEKLIKEIIEPTNFANVTVPYRENRAVLFDSALFHHTDSFKFLHISINVHKKLINHPVKMLSSRK